MFKFHRTTGKHVATEHVCPLVNTLPTVGRHVDARVTAKFIVAGAKVQAEAIIAEGKAQAESVLKADAELRAKLAQMTADAKAEADAKAKAEAEAKALADKAQRDAEKAARNALADWRFQAGLADKRERRAQAKLAKAQNATRLMKAQADERIAAFNAQAANAAASVDVVEIAFQATEIKVLSEQLAKLAGDLAAKQVEKDLADLAIQHLIDRTVPAAA